MNNLMNVSSDMEFSSLQISEWTGKDHNEVLKGIRKEIVDLGEIGVGIFTQSSYTNSQNKSQPCYKMNEDGVQQLALKYDAVSRYKCIQEMKRLRNQQPKELTRMQILEMAMETEKENLRLLEENSIKQQLIEEQEEQIITMQPKVDYHDTVLNSNNLKTVTAIAKDLSISAIKLNKILAGLGIQYYQSKTWYLKAEYQHLLPEYCDYHITEHGQSLKWTEKGRKYLIAILEDEGYIRSAITN